MSAADLARRLGARPAGRDRWTATCPACSYKSSLSLTSGEAGRVLWMCHACRDGAAVGRALASFGLPERGERQALPSKRWQAVRNDDAQRSEAARAIWRRSLPAAGTVVETYLRERGLRSLPVTLRFLGDALHAESGLRLPAMVGAIKRWPSREVQAVHRTFLRGDGLCKAPVPTPRKTLGPLAGAAVRLAPAGEVLVVGEGVESTLAAMEASGLPGWAALSTGGMAALVLPELPMAAEVVVAADHDPPGLRAAERAAARWVREGRRVRIAVPPQAAQDFNDLVRGAA